MRKEIRHVIERKEDSTTTGYTALIQDLHSLPEGRWVVSIKKYIKSRTVPQNNLLHKYLDIIADETGNSLQVVKDILKKEFLTVELMDDDGVIVCHPVTGEVLTYVKDTSALNTIDMATFTEQVRIWAMDWSIILPLPEENRTINFK